MTGICVLRGDLEKRAALVDREVKDLDSSLRGALSPVSHRATMERYGFLTDRCTGSGWRG